MLRMVSSGLLRRVALVRTDVSGELSASIIRVTRICELGTTLALSNNRRKQRPHNIISIINLLSSYFSIYRFIKILYQSKEWIKYLILKSRVKLHCFESVEGSRADESFTARKLQFRKCSDISTKCQVPENAKGSLAFPIVPQGSPSFRIPFTTQLLSSTIVISRYRRMFICTLLQNNARCRLRNNLYNVREHAWQEVSLCIFIAPEAPLNVAAYSFRFLCQADLTQLRLKRG
jgi:hypothetical protein